MSVKFELHCHNAEVSYCSPTPAAKSVALLKGEGYDGVAVTNHYYKEWFEQKPDLSETEQLDLWLSGFRKAKEAGKAVGLSVVLGMELRFTCRGANDYLVFGLTEEFVYSHPRLYEKTPEQFHALAQKEGLFILQAHPFRPPCTPENPENLDGLEVFNGHPGHNSHNEEAYAMAQRAGLLPTVGSDFHEVSQLGATAMLLPRMPKDSVELAWMLRHGEIDGYFLRDKDSLPPHSPFQQDLRFTSAIIRIK